MSRSPESEKINQEHLNHGVHHCNQTSSRIEIAFWTLAALITINVTLLMNRPIDMNLLDRVEFAQKCRDLLPFRIDVNTPPHNPNRQCAELASELTRTEGQPFDNVAAWDAFIGRQQKTLDYRQSTFRVPGINFPVPLYLIEIPFGLTYVIILLFLTIRVSELQSLMRGMENERFHLEVAKRILRHHGIDPHVPWSKIAILILLLAAIVVNIWNLTIFQLARDGQTKLNHLHFGSAALACTATLILALYLFVSWSNLYIPHYSQKTRENK